MPSICQAQCEEQTRPLPLWVCNLVDCFFYSYYLLLILCGSTMLSILFILLNFNSYNNPMGEVVGFFPPPYRWRNWDFERLSEFFKTVSYLVGDLEFEFGLFWLQMHSSKHLGCRRANKEELPFMMDLNEKKSWFTQSWMQTYSFL